MSSKNMIAFAHIEHSTDLADGKSVVQIWSVDGELQQTFAVRVEEIIFDFPFSMQWNKDDSFIAMRYDEKIFVYDVKNNKITGKAYAANNYRIDDFCWKDETNMLVTAQQHYETRYHVEIYTANVTEASDGVMLEMPVMWFYCKRCYSRLVSSALTYVGKIFLHQFLDSLQLFWLKQ